MLELKVEKRDKEVKLKSLRDEGLMPAVFYSKKQESTPISLSQSDFVKVFKTAGESTVINLLLDGKGINVLVHDVAKDPVLDEPIHVDFYAIEADKEVEVNVPLEFEGEASVEKIGGVIVYVMHELNVAGLPKDLPQSIKVDISSIKTLEDRITIGDLLLPEGIKSTLEVEEVVVSVTVAKEEEEEAPAEFDADSVEVEQKGKGEEEGDGEEKKEGAAPTEENKKEGE